MLLSRFCVSPLLNIEQGSMPVFFLCFTLPGYLLKVDACVKSVFLCFTLPGYLLWGKGGGSQCPRSRTHGVGCSRHTCEEIGEALL